MELVPKLIRGGLHEDHRGKIEFFNDFDMSLIKRVYFTTPISTEEIRAWQGHKIESRWFLCVRGSFKVKLAKISNWDNPPNSLEFFEFNLSEDEQQVLLVPSGYINGFKALEENSKLMILSDYGLNEIENDQIRFDKNKWTVWDND